MSNTLPDPADADTPEQLYRLPTGAKFNRDVLDTFMRRTLSLTIVLQRGSQSPDDSNVLGLLEAQLLQMQEYMQETLLPS